jgi:hypothetical protein
VVIQTASFERRHDILYVCVACALPPYINELFVQVCRYDLQDFTEIIYNRLEGGNVDVGCKMWTSTALMHAAQMGNVEIVKWLLSKGANPLVKRTLSDSKSRFETARDFVEQTPAFEQVPLSDEKKRVIRKILLDAEEEWNAKMEKEKEKEKEAWRIIGDRLFANVDANVDANVEKGKEKEECDVMSDNLNTNATSSRGGGILNATLDAEEECERARDFIGKNMDTIWDAEEECDENIDKDKEKKQWRDPPWAIMKKEQWNEMVSFIIASDVISATDKVVLLRNLAMKVPSN